MQRRSGKLDVAQVAVPRQFVQYESQRFALGPRQAGDVEVKYLAGVTGLVSAGADPIVVPELIITEIRSRGVNDVVEIREVPFDSGQPVRVVEGPFRGFEAIFERYLSSSERVAILLEAVQTQGIRVVMPTDFVSEPD